MKFESGRNSTNRRHINTSLETPSLEDAFKRMNIPVPEKKSVAPEKQKPQGKKFIPHSPEKIAEAKRVLSEMARQSGIEMRVKLGNKFKNVAFILSPRNERKVDGTNVEGGKEWLVIKKAFHVKEPGANNPNKEYTPTNLVQEGVPNETIINSPEEIPGPIVEGMKEGGFGDDKEAMFQWMLHLAKEADAAWRERMIPKKDAQTPPVTPSKNQ